MGELGIKNGIGLSVLACSRGNYTLVFYWYCYSLVVLIGTGFGVFFPCSFFKERLWFRRALLGHVDTGGATGAASLTSQCKCGNRSATTSA